MSPELVLVIRANSIGMDDEPDPATTNPEQALFWRNIYTEILTMEEAVLDRIRQLMATQSPEARHEVELTNVPVVVAQVERFRARWESGTPLSECMRRKAALLARASHHDRCRHCKERTPPRPRYLGKPGVSASRRLGSASWRVPALVMVSTLQNTRALKVICFAFTERCPLRSPFCLPLSLDRFSPKRIASLRIWQLRRRLVRQTNSSPHVAASDTSSRGG
jgi:hypothetical protein